VGRYRPAAGLGGLVCLLGIGRIPLSGSGNIFGLIRPTTYKECTVAATCDVCGKGPGFGHNISHSHRRTKRRWNPNLQRVRTLVGATPKRMNVCTSCIKAGKVTRA
jgi:large subunit ribosomal protein L28